MYEDEDLWPIKCGHCGEEFTEKIGRLKANLSVECPAVSLPGPVRCGTLITIRDEEFRLALAQAQAGRYDPFRHLWVRKTRP
jgi:hypothetical protein